MAEAAYNETVARAFAELTKLAYCGPLPGLFGAVATTCHSPKYYTAAPHGTCASAGFGAVPGSVRQFYPPEVTTSVTSGPFGYVFKLDSIQGSHVMPGCAVVFRGSINSVTTTKGESAEPADGLTKCQNCSVNAEYLQSWDRISHSLMGKLWQLGCMPSTLPNARGSLVHLTGHGTGAAIAAVAAWELSQAGYSLAPAYLFGSPRVGNLRFAEELHSRFLNDGSSLYSITYGNDGVPAWPDSPDYASLGYQVHYRSLNSSSHQICGISPTEGEHCGVPKLHGDALATRSKECCSSPLAPAGSFCNMTAFASQCYGGLPTQYVLGQAGISKKPAFLQQS